MEVENIIIGAGIAGITLARRIAEEKNERVLIIDKRNHIGGYCYDYRNSEGILVHKFGPHIFRTDNKKIYSFLSRFTEWIDYQHKVLAYVGGSMYPMPINLDTINSFLNSCYNSSNVLDYFKNVRTSVQNPQNVKDVIQSQVGVDFYDAFFKNYTTKQWGAEPEKLPAEIVARIPIRNNRDDRYFTLPYQGIPKEGYTQMLQNMIDHPNISYWLGIDYKKIKEEFNVNHIYYSAPIDEYYDFIYGKLPYRCVNFKFEEIDREYYQPVAVVNYPNDYDYTRITEFKHFTHHKSKGTIIAKEYSSVEGDPSYPIPTKENKELYERYLELSNKDNITFIGRLGTYKYYSMDQVISDVFDIIL